VTAAPRTIRAEAARWRCQLDDAPLALAVAPNGSGVAVAGGAGTLTVIEASEGRVRWRTDAHPHGVLDVAWSPSGDRVATVGQDGMLRLWNAADGADILARACAPPGPARDGKPAVLPWAERVRYNRSGSRLLTAAGPYASVWSADGVMERRLPSFRSTIADATWLPDGERCSIIGYSGVTIYRIDRDDAERELVWKGSFLTHAWSPSGRWLAAGMQEAAVHIFDAKSGEDLEMSGYPNKVRVLSWDADGRRLATGGGRHVSIWGFAGKGPAGTRPTVVAGHLLPITALAYYRSGSMLATGGEDGQVLAWDLARTTSAPISAGFDTGPVAALAWHGTERALISAHGNGAVIGWPVVR
jgi:WD40 repeat protein